jgi:chromosomal replication initiator protein
MMTNKGPLPRQLILEFPSQPEYSFSNFIVSDGSKIAFDAAHHFCSDSSSFKILYFFGTKNLGKTHLLLSIGNKFAAMNKKALYIHGADFVKKTDENSNGSSGEFISTLSNIDLFLFDEVDYIEGEITSQEKLYLIINSLIEKEKKIAFASNFNPAKLKNTENYLISRFQWGMSTELKPIDDNTTAKIITKLAKDIRLVLPDKLIVYLLTHIPRDFISIKYAITKINQESYIRKKKVTLSLVKETLSLP